MVKKIRKRDGSVVFFQEDKIAEAIWKAARAVGGEDKERPIQLAGLVVEKLNEIYGEFGIPEVEEVQDLVEKILIEEGHAKVAKAYILYRQSHDELRKVKGLFDTIEAVEDYIGLNDWMVKENSNMGFSLQGLNNYIGTKIIANYWMRRVYPEAIRKVHEAGDLHIHDLGTLGAYCVGWDLKDLLSVGFRGVKGKVESRPPKHLGVALGQIVNFFYTLQGESAGAQAFSNFDTLLAPFIRYENLNYRQVKKAVQSFLFNMAVPTRVGFQTPFTNITMDLEVPDYMRDEHVIIGGQPQIETYKEFKPEMNMLNQAFAECMLEGDSVGQVFTFPIPTYNITKDFNWDNPEYDLIWEMTAKYGIPYFSNFVNSDMRPEDARSMCCRLRIDNTQLRKRGGGLFGSNPQTGCYDDKTEILTEDGWKFFKDLNKKDKVFTLSGENKVELHKPKKYFVYEHNEKMVRFKNRMIDLLVTPNHRMIVDQVGSGKRKFVEAKDFDYNNQRIPKRGIWDVEDIGDFILPGIEYIKYGRQGRTSYKVFLDSLKINMNHWLKFFGFWIAEGCVDNDNIAKSHGYRIIVTQKDKKNRKDFEKVLESLPFNYYKEKNNYIICNKQLWTYLKQFGKSYDKFIPVSIKALGKRQLKILFEWMMRGDGHIRKTNGQMNYWTSSKRLADDMQEIIMKLGWLSSVGIQKDKVTYIRGRKIKSSTNYIIGVNRFRHYRLRKDSISEVDYRGKVYCVEVENNSVLVRRNGKMCWCGNSIGVVTINMARLGFVSTNDEDFFGRLDRLMELAKESLEIKRKAIENFTKVGLYPYSKFYLRQVYQRFEQYWKNHFATIGLLGMNEAIMNFMSGENITTEKGREFALKILDFMRKKLEEFQNETGNIYNLEATPGEGCTYRFARMDKKRFGRIIVANEEAFQKGANPYYTNSSHLPVNFTSDVFEALDLQDEFQCKYTGGCVEKGNKVLTNKGLIEIEKIVVNFNKMKPISVVSFDPKKGKSEWDEITNVYEIDVSKHDKIRIVAERNLDITTSDWHPFFVLGRRNNKDTCSICRAKVLGVKSFAGHLKNNLKCLEEYRNMSKYAVFEKRADELKKGDYILQNVDNLLPTTKGIDKDLMWLIGFYIGDGHIVKFVDDRGGNSLEKYGVRFHSEHKNVLERVCKILNSKFGAGVSVISNDKRSEKLHEVSCSKKKVVDFFFDLGFKHGKKVYSVSVPKKVREGVDRKNIFSFLSGLMDSDGHISKKQGDFEYYSVSRKLIEGVFELLSVAGVLSNVSIKKTRRENEAEIYKIRIPNCELCRIGEDLMNIVNRDFIGSLSNRKKRHLPVVRVKSVSKVDVSDEKFYDLTTRKNHNYLAGKNSLVFVHNTVFHTFVGERMTKDSVKKMVKKIAENYHLPYFTITPTFSVCPIHGYLAGEHEYCPKCDAEQEMLPLEVESSKKEMAEEEVISGESFESTIVGDESIAVVGPRVEGEAREVPLLEVVDGRQRVGGLLRGLSAMRSGESKLNLGGDIDGED